MIGIYRHQSGWLYCQEKRQTGLAPGAERPAGNEDYGYQVFFASVDAVVMNLD